jgi:hypothetical protein
MDDIYGSRNVGRAWWKPEDRFKDVSPEMKSKLAWYGHIPFGLHKYVGCKYVTIFRDPLTRLLSDFDTLRKQRDPSAATIEKYTEKNDNLFVRMITGNMNTKLSAKHLNKAIHNIKDYFAVIGFINRYDEFISSVSWYLGVSINNIPNISTRKHTDYYDDMVGELRDHPRVKGAVEYDSELYNILAPL